MKYFLPILECFCSHSLCFSDVLFSGYNAPLSVKHVTSPFTTFFLIMFCDYIDTRINFGMHKICFVCIKYKTIAFIVSQNIRTFSTVNLNIITPCTITILYTSLEREKYFYQTEWSRSEEPGEPFVSSLIIIHMTGELHWLYSMESHYFGTGTSIFFLSLKFLLPSLQLLLQLPSVFLNTVTQSLWTTQLYYHNSFHRSNPNLLEIYIFPIPLSKKQPSQPST